MYVSLGPYFSFPPESEGADINPERKTFGRNFLLCFLCNNLVISNLVLFLYYNRYLEQLGATKTQIGIYMGALALGSVVVRPVVGGLVDRYGRKQIMYFGLALMISATAGYFFCRELNWLILLVRICHGIGFGCYITGIFTVVADDAPSTRRAKVIGVFGLSGALAFALFPIVAESVIGRFGFQALFAVALLALVGALAVCKTISAIETVELEFPPVSFITLVRQPDLLIPVGALFFFCTGVGSLVNFIAVYLAPKGVSVSYFFVSSSAASAVVRIYLGHLSDVYGRRLVALPAFVAGSLALFWLGLFNFPWELLVCGLLWGMGIGFCVPAVAASVVDRVKPQDRGKGLALFTASFDLGVMAGSFAYGTVAEQIGYSRMYLAASGIVLISAAIARSFRN